MKVAVASTESQDSYWHDGEQWGSWTASYSFSIDGVKEVGDDYQTSYGEDVYLVADGSTVIHVIYMRYGDGDSFGHADGRGDVLHAFGNREKAEAALKSLQAHKDDFSVKVMDDLDREVSMWNPGAGYFESIDEIGIESFHIDSAPIRIKF